MCVCVCVWGGGGYPLEDPRGVIRGANVALIPLYEKVKQRNQKVNERKSKQECLLDVAVCFNRLSMIFLGPKCFPNSLLTSFLVSVNFESQELRTFRTWRKVSNTYIEQKAIEILISPTSLYTYLCLLSLYCLFLLGNSK